MPSRPYPLDDRFTPGAGEGRAARWPRGKERRRVSWKDTIANCFEPEASGNGHKCIQAAAAKGMIATAKRQGATFEELEREVVWFCYCKVKTPGRLQDPIAVEVARAHRLWSPT